MTMTGTADTRTWSAPGPGVWERDAAHQERPFSTLWMEVAPGTLGAGTSDAFARFGIPFSRFEAAGVEGWFFGTFVPAPEEAIAERIDVAERALVERPWRAIADEWHATVRDRFAQRNRDIQRVEPRNLDDQALGVHLDTTLQWLRESATRHFLHSVAHWVGVGLLANEAQQLAGWTPDRTVRALSGASPASKAPLASAQRVASAVRAEPSAQAVLVRDDDPAEMLEALRASSPGVREALDAYLDEHGWQVFTGFDFTHQAIAELPGVLLATIRSVPPHDEPRANPMAELLEHVPAGDRDRIADLIDEAVLVYGLRDDDSGLTIQQPLGLVRRALLEAGRRLEARGAIERADDIFDATAAELRALLTAPEPGLKTELAGRAARRRADSDVPPRRLGSDDPPPDEPLPPAMATVMAALFTSMQLEDTADEEATTGMELRGSAASDGVYEGPARLIRGEGDFERLEHGDVLVAPMTTPAYNVVLPLLGAVVTDRGGVLSHPAIVAREYGIPAVVGTGDATTRIADGARIRVDGRAGTVTILPQ